MPLATLSIDLEARLASMEKTFSQAVGMADASSKQIASKFEAAGIAVKAAFGAVAAGLSLGAMATTVRSLVDGVDALNDFADATGSTVEKAGALEDIAKRTGTTMDTVTAAVVKLNAGLKETDPKSPVALALQQIGLSAADLRKDDPADALLKVAMALRQFDDDGNKARLTQEVFGKSLREVAPLLNDLADKGQLVATVTSDQAKEAEKFNKQLFELSKNAEDAKRAILSDYLPAINEALKTLRDKGVGGTILSALGLDQDFKDKAVLAEAAAKVNSLNSELKTLQAQMRADPTNAAVGRWGERAKQLTDELEKAKAAFRAADKAYLGLTDGSAGGGRGFVNPAVAEAPKPSVGEGADQKAIEAARRAAEEARKTYEGLIAKIKERQELATDELVAGEKLSASDQFRAQVIGALDKEASKLNDTQRAQVRAALDTAVAVMKANEAHQESVALMSAESRAIAQRLQQRDDELQGLRRESEEIGLTVSQLEDLRIARLEDAIARKEQSIAAAELLDATSPAIDQMRQEVDAMRENVAVRREMLSKTRDLAKDPLKGAQAGVAQYLDEVSRAGDATRDAVKGALSDLEDGLTQFAMTGKLDIKSLVTSMITEFVRLNAIRPMLSSLLSATSSGGGGASSWLGTAISFAASYFGGGSAGGAGTVSGGSGITLGGVSAGSSAGGGSMYSLTGKAIGGPVEADTAYLVGEAGPEVAMFRQGGQILPAGLTKQLMQGGGGRPLNLNIYQTVGEIVTPAQLSEAMEMTRQGAIAGMADAQRRGRI